MNSENNIPQELILWYQVEKGGSVRALARDIGVTPATLYYWVKNNQIPLRYLGTIERISDGKFNRQNIRPDVFK